MPVIDNHDMIDANAAWNDDNELDLMQENTQEAAVSDVFRALSEKESKKIVSCTETEKKCPENNEEI